MKLHRLGLFACLLLSLLPLSLRAQAVLINSNNRAQSGGTPLDAPGRASAQAFTTGSVESQLHSISVKLVLYETSQVSVKLWSGPGNFPISLIEDLGTISNVPLGASSVLFSSTVRPQLAPNTRYWVSVANVSGNFDWTLTSLSPVGDNEGSFENLSRQSPDGGTTWPNEGDADRLHRVTVYGTLFRPGNIDTSFGADETGADTSVTSIVVQPDGKILLGGVFSKVSDDNATHNRSRIARLNPDGSVDTTFGGDGSGFNGSVWSVALQSDGKILVGGGFSTFSDGNATHSRLRIARLNSDGSLDISFNTDVEGTNSSISALAVQPDGKVLIGGNFTGVSDGTGSHSRLRIARLNSDGTVDTSFGADGSGTDGTILSIADQTDGKILLGGEFTNVVDTSGTFSRSRIARFNADGTVDTAFGKEGCGGDHNIWCITLQADNKILIAGRFSAVSDGISVYPRRRIARLNADGSVDSSFVSAGTGSDSIVDTVATQADGKILLGGFFNTVSSGNRLGIARLNPDGTIDANFGTNGKGVSLLVRCLAIQADGKILIGGDFSTVTGATDTRTRANIARLENDATLSRISMPDPTRVQWLRDGTTPEAMRVTVDVSTDNGSNYAFLGNASRIPGGWELSDVEVPSVRVLRLRAFVSGTTGSGIIEALDGLRHSRRPLLTVSGKRKLTTGKGRFTLTGTASDPDGDLTSVRYRDAGGRWLTAMGIANWTAKAKLKPGRNTILIAAYDSRNDSSAIMAVKVKLK
ncbi:MAG: hypothetical protein JNJ70_16860 [Verrucomicrobiales bacterium]|nr:hypothetical protein [Verrucomicrobiales bacterium]